MDGDLTLAENDSKVQEPAEDVQLAASMDDDELVAQVKKWESDAITNVADHRRVMRENRGFYFDEQWDDDTLAQLQAAGKPALTFNRIKGIINFLQGVQRQNRRDPKVIARRGGLDTVANVRTAILRHQMDIDGVDLLVSCQFFDGITCREGWIGAEVAYEEDPFSGSVAMCNPNPLHMLCDPLATEYDLSDAGWVIRRRRYKENELRLRYPGKIESSPTGNPNVNAALGHSTALAMNLLGTGAGGTILTDPLGEDDTLPLSDGDSLWVTECWIREPSRMTAFNVDGQVYKYYEGDEGIAQMVAAGYPSKEILCKRLIKVVLHGDTLLERTLDPLGPVRDFPYRRFVPYFYHGLKSSVVDALKCPQQEHNKRRSLMLHHYGQTANSGWIVKKLMAGAQTFFNMFGSKPGVVLSETEHGGGKLERITPAPLDSAGAQMAMAADEDMRVISGINTANLGLEGNSSESGKLNELKQRQGLLVSEVLFDNLDKTVSGFYQLVSDVIASNGIYSDDEVAKLVDQNQLLDSELVAQAAQMVQQQFPPPPPPGPEIAQLAPEQQAYHIQMHQQAMAGWQQQVEPRIKQAAIGMLMQQLKDQDITRYGLVMSDSPRSPTLRMAAFAQLAEMATQFPGLIPPEELVDSSSLAKDVRERVKGFIGQQRQMQAQSAQVPTGGAA